MPTEDQVPDMMASLDAMMAAQDVNDVWDIFCDAMDVLGFVNMIYGGSRIAVQGIIGDPKDALILQYGPQAYADVYLGQELYRASPTYTWAAKHTGFARWPDTIPAGMIPTPEMIKIAELNAKFDVFAGFVGSLNDVVPGMTGVIGMSPGRGMLQVQADEIWAQSGEKVETLSRILQLRIASLPLNGPRRPLTSRQREALTWCAQGKTMQDVATIMELSVATVEKHLRMAREALDALTTAHAVQKATSFNLLSL